MDVWGEEFRVPKGLGSCVLVPKDPEPRSVLSIVRGDEWSGRKRVVTLTVEPNDYLHK